MSENWTTHRGDEWWFKSYFIKADGWINNAFPKAIEVSINYKESQVTEQNLYHFLCETSAKFDSYQIWITLDKQIQDVLTILKFKKLIDYTYTKNPLSVTARITSVFTTEKDETKSAAKELTFKRRRELKRLGKSIVERQSSEWKKNLALSNPAPIGSNEWAKNYKQIALKEKEYQGNRTKVFSKKMIDKEFLSLKVDYDFEKGYLPIQGYYLHCLKCGDLLPMNPIINLNCRCQQIIINPTLNKINILENDVEVVKLLPMAKKKSSFINAVLKKLNKFFNVTIKYT